MAGYMCDDIQADSFVGWSNNLRLHVCSKHK